MTCPASTSSLNSSTFTAFSCTASSAATASSYDLPSSPPGIVRGAGPFDTMRGTGEPLGSSAGTSGPREITRPAGTSSDSTSVTSAVKSPAAVSLCVASSSVMPARSVGTGAGVLPNDTNSTRVPPSSSCSPAAGSVSSTSPGVLPSRLVSRVSISKP